MPFKKNNPGCAPGCGCPTCEPREFYGLPDVIQIDFGILSSSDEGMPEDTPYLTCFEGHAVETTAWNHWNFDDWIMERLRDMGPFFVEFTGESSPCCFNYSLIGQSTLSDPCHTEGEYIDLGPSPLGESYWLRESGGTCTSEVGTVTPVGVGCSETPEEICSCCDAFSESKIGNKYTPEHAFLYNLSLRICISGDIVSIRVFYQWSTGCSVVNGHETFGDIVPIDHPCTSCALFEKISDFDDPSCPGGLIHDGDILEDEVDTSELPGDTIWERIDGYEFETPFEIAHCLCAGGCECADPSTGAVLCIDRLMQGCADLGCLGNCGWDVFQDTPQPTGFSVDRQCYYAVGIGTITLSDGGS